MARRDSLLPARPAMAATVADAAPSALTTTTIEDIHPDVLTRALRLLDGAALSAAGCATSRLRALAAHPGLWEDLCLSTWPSLRHPRFRDLLPSFPASHRSFFSEAFPFPDPAAGVSPSTEEASAALISAVDLFHGGEHVFSRVIETDARDPWFLGSPFRVDALERKDEGAAMVAPISPEDLTLSWVVIDPARRRAVNLSSRKPVSVERHWYTEEIQVRFAAVLGGVTAATAVVACGEETMQPREVSLTVEDADGMCLNGKESLAVLCGAMEGGRKGWGGKGEADARGRYAAYVAGKEERKERRMRREGRFDMCCILFGISLFLTLLAFVALW